jgi:splicing factor 1
VLHLLLLHAVQVVLSGPGAVTHYSDPKLQRLHESLNELNRKLTAGELDIPPEHERSPSPEPIYDANGVRQNTREIRCVRAAAGSSCSK